MVAALVRAVHVHRAMARRRTALPSHLESADIRPDRWHRGRADDLAAGAAAGGAQLGLPLLLAARLPLHAAGALERGVPGGSPGVAAVAAAGGGGQACRD